MKVADVIKDDIKSEAKMDSSLSEHFISIIVPVYNEEGNIFPLCSGIVNVLDPLRAKFEVVLVNDGSTDETAVQLDCVADEDRRFKVIHFKRNYGQTSAMMAGIDFAAGDIIVPMDGDLQNDPGDIPKLIAKINEGYDVCSGWRKERKDNFILRILPSRFANILISSISGVKLNDYGCTLKTYRRDVIKNVKLYGEMHRFIPVYASWLGAKVTEIPVIHHPRKNGTSKYGLIRSYKVIMDLLVVKFMEKYLQKPIYVFGGFAFFNVLMTFLSFSGMVYYKFWGNKTFIETPLPLLTVFFLLTGVISLLMGLIAEILVRTYFESQHMPAYVVDKTKNIGSE